MGRLSAKEYGERIDTIVKLIIKGLDKRAIVRWVRSKTEWGIDDSLVYRYIDEALGEIKAAAVPNLKEEIGKALSRLQDLYAKCILIQDYKTALAVQKELNELLGFKSININAPSNKSWADILAEARKQPMILPAPNLPGLPAPAEMIEAEIVQPEAAECEH